MFNYFLIFSLVNFNFNSYLIKNFLKTWMTQIPKNVMQLHLYICFTFSVSEKHLSVIAVLTLVKNENLIVKSTLNTWQTI